MLNTQRSERVHGVDSNTGKRSEIEAAINEVAEIFGHDAQETVREIVYLPQ